MKCNNVSKKSERYIKLSYDCDKYGPYPPGIPIPKITKFTSLEKGDVANQYMITICNHTGTHVDAPAHVVDDGLRISDFDVSDFVYESLILIDVKVIDYELMQPKLFERYEKNIAESDILLIRTGYCKYRKKDTERYKMKGPGFSARLAEYIVSSFPNLKALGLDAISLAAIKYIDEGMEAHKVLLSGINRKFLIYEAMDLRPNLSGLKKLIALPWLIKEIDSAPCSILGII